MRNPKAGRGWERNVPPTYPAFLPSFLSCSRLLVAHSCGPHPYLDGEGAFEMTTEVQSVGVMACAKHLVANNQEHWRYGLSANVDERKLQEIYWYPSLWSIEMRLRSYRVRSYARADVLCPPGWRGVRKVCMQPVQRYLFLPPRRASRAQWAATEEWVPRYTGLLPVYVSRDIHIIIGFVASDWGATHDSNLPATTRMQGSARSNSETISLLVRHPCSPNA